jgi:hypothetical protein
VPTQVGQSQSELDEQTSTTNLLQLARRLHEEHVREGVEKRDALIAEGHATAARVVAEAEAKQRQQMGILDQERLSLEKRVDELRSFERDYRQKLKSYIEARYRRARVRFGQPGLRRRAACTDLPGLWRLSAPPRSAPPLRFWSWPAPRLRRTASTS